MSSNDIIFICEHWLAQEEENNVHKFIGVDHQLIFLSHFNLANKKFFEKKQGRPHGGVLWLVSNKLILKDFVQLSDQISKIVIQINQVTDLTIYGVWLGFDDTQNRAESFSSFKNNLLILESELKIPDATEAPFVFVGDFNADLNRKKRFDNYLNKFLVENNLISCESIFEKSELNYTYKKGKNTAYIDHAICRIKHNEYITHYSILNDPENASDHQPIQIEVVCDSFDKPSETIVEKDKNKIHHFKWNEIFKKSFNKFLSQQLKSSISIEQI